LKMSTGCNQNSVGQWGTLDKEVAEYYNFSVLLRVWNVRPQPTTSNTVSFIHKHT
jgi:hypothetical protein